MRYVLIFLAILASWSLATNAQEPAESPLSRREQAPLFRSAPTDLVVLPVTVSDEAGRLVDGLEAHHFEVYDEGRRQAIRAFTNADHPVSIALVVDNSGSMVTRVGELRAATLAFARQSHQSDELRIISFNDVVRDALDGRAVSAGETAVLDRAIRTLRPEGRTALYDALVAGLEYLDDASHARRVLILVSDGGDNASSATLDAVLARARRSNVTIYAIGLHDPEARDRNPRVLKRLAEETGGVRYLPRSPGVLIQLVGQIAREIRQSYTLGFEAPERDGRFHRLRVQLQGPDVRGLRVRTRPGYLADGGEP